MHSKNKSLTPSELVKKHISDPSHVITDEELKKVKVGITDEGRADEKMFTSGKEINTPIHKEAITNPYDLLDL
jgi:hypothetical protein